MLTNINKNLACLTENAKVEVSFKELESDPVSALQHIYNKLKLNYSQDFEASVKEWLSGMKSYQKNKYELSETEKETIRKILVKHFIYYNYKQ